jgi:hypothetical protein
VLEKASPIGITARVAGRSSVGVSDGEGVAEGNSAATDRTGGRAAGAAPGNARAGSDVFLDVSRTVGAAPVPAILICDRGM